MSKPPSIEFGYLSQAELVGLRKTITDQKGVLPLFVHPFYNLLVEEAYWVHNYGQFSDAQLHLFELFARNKRGETTQFINSLPQDIHRENSEGNSVGINESHQRYYQRLNHFLANTTFHCLAVLEQANTIPITDYLIRDAGYMGLLLFIASKLNDPSPANGHTFTELADFLVDTEVTKLVVAGQNSWIMDRSPTHPINQLKPFVEKATSAFFGNHQGCVGRFLCDLGIEYDLLYSHFKSGVPIKFILSKIMWPQRRVSDPTNTEFLKSS